MSKAPETLHLRVSGCGRGFIKLIQADDREDYDRKPAENVGNTQSYA